MAANRTAKLLVQLSGEDRRKLILPDGIPDTMEELLVKVRDTCGVQGDFRLQYQDREFGVFVTLTNTGDLENLGTIKVIPLMAEGAAAAAPTTELDPLPDEDPSTSDIDSPMPLSSSASLASPESVSSRTQPWPKVFPIPVFAYDTELQLERGNASFLADGTRLIPSRKMLHDILERTADEIYKYKSYTTKQDRLEVAEALIDKHPCLQQTGLSKGAHAWEKRLTTKLGNQRTYLKGLGCTEFAVNSLKNKSPDDAKPAKKVKRPKRGEANHMPSLPLGESAEQLEKERQALLREVKKRNNERIIREKMAKTFSLFFTFSRFRRQEIVDKQPNVEVVQERRPALFEEEEVVSELIATVCVIYFVFTVMAFNPPACLALDIPACSSLLLVTLTSALTGPVVLLYLAVLTSPLAFLSHLYMPAYLP